MNFFTLTVTLTEVITRWVHSGDQLFTSSPPKTAKDWDSTAFPLVSRQDEHTTGFRCSTLSCSRDRNSKRESWERHDNQLYAWREFSRFRGTNMNLLSNTPNVTLSPEFRFTAVFSVMRWPLMNVPYLEQSFKIIPYKHLNITLVKQACHIYLPLLKGFTSQKQIKFKMTTKQNIDINSLVCFSLHWKTLLW